MKLLGRKSNDDEEAPDAESASDPQPAASSGTTAPKGRPTPKRNASARRRGPVAPAPMTVSEARKRRREMRRTMTSEERRADKLRRRAAVAERRERMMAGEEDYLLPRDKGPVRRFVRDIVDSRRNVLGLFMPAALSLIFVMLAVPRVQLFISPAMLLMMLAMVLDAVLLSRKVNRAVAAKFPENTESRWKLGLYAAGRASQIRRMRMPRPMVARGAKVL